MGKQTKYHGVVVPMITPFTSDGKVDISAASKVTEHIVANGAVPFVLGTTGEASSVPDSEKSGFVEAVVKQVAGRTLTYAGIASNCVSNSVELSKQYFDLGADAVVANLPSYYPLTADHMLKFYELLAENVPGPLVLYNITITTHMSIPLDIVDKLSHHPNIVALKDSEKNEERFEQALEMWKDREDFAHLCGSAALSTKALSLGSDGIIPSTGNFAPKIYVDLYEAAKSGDLASANEIQERTNELSRIYQKGRILSQALSALKVIMKNLDLCQEYVLPPLVSIPEQEKQGIIKMLKESGVTS